MHHNIQMLGNGVYPISEAARYIQIQDSTLRYWFKSKSILLCYIRITHGWV